MASENATQDQASDHSIQNLAQRSEFDLDITEADPTPDQVKSIMDYLGGSSAASKIVKDATGESDAMSKIKSRPDNFLRPIVRCHGIISLAGLVSALVDRLADSIMQTVDWNNGKAGMCSERLAYGRPAVDLC